MLIGGHALPAYGQIRATMDVDLAIAADYQDIVRLQEQLRERGYQVPAKPDPAAPLFIVTDLENRFEVEIWTKPDGVIFDEELLRRRVKVHPFNNAFEMFVIGPEDFIVNKLARQDKGVQDEQDVISVLKRQKGKLDYDYLAKRAQQANVNEQLQLIMQMSGTRP
jgi:hypothetical protein